MELMSLRKQSLYRTSIKWQELVCLIVIIGLGLLVRFEDLKSWQEYPEIAFAGGEPVLTTFDGYFYLSLSRDLLDGTYHPIDEKRAVPDYQPRPSPAPLLSHVLSFLSKTTHLSLNWLAILIPPILGVMVAVPIFLLGRLFAGPVTGLTAAIGSLLSYYYLIRTNVGWLDTDCLNVFFILMLVYLACIFAITQSGKRYFYFALYLLFAILFFWWWDQAPDVVIAICVSQILIAILFLYRPQSKREGALFVGSAIVLPGILLLWLYPDFSETLVRGILGKINHISKETTDAFPGASVAISEQQKSNFTALVNHASNSWQFLSISCLGLLGLLYVRPRYSILLFVPAGLSLLAFLFAERFIIFILPLTALGFGFFVHCLWQYRSIKYLHLAAPLLLILYISDGVDRAFTKTIWPDVHPLIVKGMTEAKTKTPLNSVIWSWWDHGYHINYWADRATVNDGSVHSGERTVYNALPLVSQSYRESANFMRFFVEHGVRGVTAINNSFGDDRQNGIEFLKNILRIGPEEALLQIKQMGIKPIAGLKTADDWLNFFYPPPTKPLYLFLDYRMMQGTYWWYWFGNWNFSTRSSEHAPYLMYTGLTVGEKFVTRFPGFRVDLQNGIFQAGPDQVSLLATQIFDRKSLAEYHYEAGEKGILQIYKPDGYGVLQNKLMINTIANKLYVTHNYRQKYFEPIAINGPWYQLWQVNSDIVQR